MKFTHKTLRAHYIEDLKLPDVTHGGRRKAFNPEHWNFESTFKLNETLVNPTDPVDPLSGRNIWVWSDIHLDHKNIIKYSGRPYPTVELMNKCLIGNYINTVKDGDIVFFCGDITFGSVGKVNEMLDKLPGYKIHIVGNHDMDRGGKLNGLRMDERHSCYVMDVVDAEVEYQLLITHYPLDIVPDGCFNIHGHIHQHPAPTNKHFNVCVEHTNFTPRNLNTILAQAKIYMEGHA